MAALDDFYDDVMPHLGGAEKPLVDLHIRRAVRDFLSRTTLWRATIAVPTAIGQSDYPLTPTATDSAVAGVYACTFDGGRMDNISEQRQPLPGVVLQNGQPRAYAEPVRALLRVYPAPDRIANLNVGVVLTLPLDPSVATVPDFVVEHYRDVVADGILSNLLLIAKKPWSDPQMGLLRRSNYNNAVLRQRADLRGGGERHNEVISIPRFGR